MIDTQSIERTNGLAHHQSGGRDVPALPAYTFQDTRRVVHLKQKVSPYVGDKILKDYEKLTPRPQPPVQKVPTDDQGNFVEEILDDDPSYKKQLTTWLKKFNSHALDRTVSYIANVCVDRNDLDQEAVANHVAFFGNDDNLSEIELYIRFICPGSSDDLVEFVNFVSSRSQPTQEQIDDKVRTFRQDV